MGRMDRYKEDELIPKRSDKNKTLYKQIYNAYDDFENLVVPSNSREIKLTDLQKEITSREEYHDRKFYDDITNRSEEKEDKSEVIDIPKRQPKENDDVYDINLLLDKAMLDSDKEDTTIENTLSNEEYLKKLKLDNYKMKALKLEDDKVEDEEMAPEDEDALLKTANLSLEILSDLKSDNDETRVEAPIKEEEEPTSDVEYDFYSSNYKFTKKDFEDKDDEDEDEDEEEEDEEDPRKRKDKGSGKLFIKIALSIFGILLAAVVLLYLFHYFNRV